MTACPACGSAAYMWCDNGNRICTNCGTLLGNIRPDSRDKTEEREHKNDGPPYFFAGPSDDRPMANCYASDPDKLHDGAMTTTTIEDVSDE